MPPVAKLPKLRLYNSNGSPFCLKVVVLARELGLIDAITLDYSVVPHPTKQATPQSLVVPHGKIPALIVDDSTPIYGSENICAYLDSLAGGKALPPPGELRRFEVLTTEALASAMCDAALLLRYERVDRVRPRRRLGKRGQLISVRLCSRRSSTGPAGLKVNSPRSHGLFPFSRRDLFRILKQRCWVWMGYGPLASLLLCTKHSFQSISDCCCYCALLHGQAGARFGLANAGGRREARRGALPLVALHA
jgi:hypothetical protein